MLPTPPRPWLSYSPWICFRCSRGGSWAEVIFAAPPRPVEWLWNNVRSYEREEIRTHSPSRSLEELNFRRSSSSCSSAPDPRPGRRLPAPPRPVECRGAPLAPWGSRERERLMLPIPPRPVLTGAPSWAWTYSRMTSCSLLSISPRGLLASREGERRFPAPPRPVEKTVCWWKISKHVGFSKYLWCTWSCLAMGSRPRVAEKSSGPELGRSSRDLEAARMFPMPPRPLEC